MRMMVSEQEQSGHHHHSHMHHHHGHLRHGHVVGNIDRLLGADNQEMANVGPIGHDLHHGRRGCGHLRHRGRKVLGVVFHGGGHMHGPFGRHGAKQHGKHGRGHHGNKLHGHGHGHGHHHGMKRKKNKGRHCCGCCLGGQEGTCVGQAILGRGDEHAAGTAVEETATQGQDGDGAATQLITSLLETQLVVSEREP